MREGREGARKCGDLIVVELESGSSGTGSSVPLLLVIYMLIL